LLLYVLCNLEEIKGRGQYELPGNREIKAVLTKMMKKGCMLMIPAYGAEGRIVSIGFRPYWTNPGDSK